MKKRTPIIYSALVPPGFTVPRASVWFSMEPFDPQAPPLRGLCYYANAHANVDLDADDVAWLLQVSR